MKRYSDLFSKIVSLDNLSIAFDKATKHKRWRNNIKKCIEHKEQIIQNIHKNLINKTYHTSQYRTKTIYEPKERLIYILPFAPDRIVHHAIMNVLEPILDKRLIYDTYSCRVCKGQMKASDRCLSYCKKYKYCLQFDISKFYPSINHEILKSILKGIFKDKDLIWLLDEIIDSTNTPTNVPIGNYLSQWFGNIYLSKFDRFLISKGFTKLVRYCDDTVVFSNDKKALASLVQEAREFLHQELNLKLSKSKILSTHRGITFLGFRHFKRYVLLKRKTAIRIKTRLKYLPYKLEHKKIKVETAQGQVASAIGWLAHANCYNLTKSLNIISLCKQLNIYTERIATMNHVENILEPIDQLCTVLPMSILVNKSVIFLGSDLFTKKDKKYLRIVYKLLNSKEEILYISFTQSKVLIKLFEKYKAYFPFDGMITKVNNWYALVPSNWSKHTMKGFPKNLNTKEDYLYIKEHFERNLWVPEFQKLLDTTSDWFFVKNLDTAEDGITDDTHKVVETEISSDEPTVISQYEFRENPDAKLYKLGFTVEEVQQLIA